LCIWSEDELTQLLARHGEISFGSEGKGAPVFQLMQVLWAEIMLSG
jgi:hypothetical protein